MPRYISLHTLACLTRQGAEQLTARLAAAERVTARRVQLNMIEGKCSSSSRRRTGTRWKNGFATKGFITIG